ADAYVFREGAADFGGAAAVARRNGRSAFGGSIVWNGAGDITYPKRAPAAELGPGCGARSEMSPARGFDLRDGSALPAGGHDALRRSFLRAIQNRVHTFCFRLRRSSAPSNGQGGA